MGKSDPTETMFKNENGDKIEKLIQRMERMDVSWKIEKAQLETKLETQNMEMKNLQKEVENRNEDAANLKKQVTEIESRLEEEIADLKSELRMKIADFQNQCKVDFQNQCQSEVKSEVEKGLRDLPFEMVCAYQDRWTAENSIVTYDHISLEFNNSDRPGGADGSMNIETGVFTTVTSGYYIVTFGGTVYVHSGEFTVMYLYHNGVQLEESRFYTSMATGNGDNYIGDQASKTVILHLLAGDTLDLRTENIGRSVYRITLCVYMAPAPYGI